MAALLGLAAWTQFSASPPVALQQLARWLPTLLLGLGANIGISVLAMREDGYVEDAVLDGGGGGGGGAQAAQLPLGCVIGDVELTK